MSQKSYTFFIILLCISFLAFLACTKDSQQQVKKGDFNVEFLFENDGCKVYRFYDGGRYIYYSNCNGKTEWSESTGKTTYKMQTLNSK